MEGKLENRLLELIQGKERELGRRLSYSEIARATGVGEKVIQRWVEEGVTRFDAKVIIGICRFFECEVGDLLYIEWNNDAA